MLHTFDMLHMFKVVHVTSCAVLKSASTSEPSNERGATNWFVPARPCGAESSASERCYRNIRIDELIGIQIDELMTCFELIDEFIRTYLYYILYIIYIYIYLCRLYIIYYIIDYIMLYIIYYILCIIYIYIHMSIEYISNHAPYVWHAPHV